jgi:hypothetical protein
MTSHTCDRASQPPRAESTHKMVQHTLACDLKWTQQNGHSRARGESRDRGRKATQQTVGVRPLVEWQRDVYCFSRLRVFCVNFRTTIGWRITSNDPTSCGCTGVWRLGLWGWRCIGRITHSSNSCHDLPHRVPALWTGDPPLWKTARTRHALKILHIRKRRLCLKMMKNPRKILPDRITQKNSLYTHLNIIHEVLMLLSQTNMCEKWFYKWAIFS